MTHTRDLDQLLERKLRLEERATAAAGSGMRLTALRSWQAGRLERTYATLRRQERYVPALDFFLADLYGPGDFSRRDADLRRALAPLKRALPARLLDLLCMAIELQVLTLDLDEQMAAALDGHDIDANTYAAAYRSVGRPQDRRRQIDLIVRIGQDLDELVRQPWMRLALRAAHMPAHLAGFGALQEFLERGFQAFRRMGNARDLLATIMRRETQIMSSLLRGDASPLLQVVPDADA